jgi:hypothetical protein
MLIEQHTWSAASGWEEQLAAPRLRVPQLVLALGARRVLQRGELLASIRERWPRATLLIGSTGGEIQDTRVTDDSLVVTVVELERSRIVGASIDLEEAGTSEGAGAALAKLLPHEGLRHVFVLSDGLRVNGSALAQGMSDGLPRSVAVTGGLAGDGSEFKETVVGLDAAPRSGVIAAIGFYGESLAIGMGTLGGWDVFGPDRLITRSEANVLFELDGLPALDLYKKYLGRYAAELPANGLLFPLSVHDGSGDHAVVRTILAVDEATGSLTFAGDVPVGKYARLMRANLDRLVDGAAGAATASVESVGGQPPELAILVSCVGRKWVLKQRVEEEVENVREILGPGAAITGLYSYGEISPFTPSARCELHNQTMTITTLREA